MNPNVVVDPTVAPSGPKRDILGEDFRNQTIKRRDRERILVNHGTEHQRGEDSMLASKAQLMAQTIDSGTIDQVKEQLLLLGQFEDSYVNVQNRIRGQGKADYDQTAHDLLSELPFMKKHRMHTSRHSSDLSNAGDLLMTNGNN